MVISDALALSQRLDIARMANQVYVEAGRDPTDAEIVRTGIRIPEEPAMGGARARRIAPK
ncbi:hypothetical protein [Nonomuraea basaltis]|uniref:hypothetical protein n=1 Tax=Nonomuraea basaltis TaxID=2495887 RepID=UPI00110C6370|nr:hypothetical protein [Nonomuraea basaltis]TMR94829.1 hypothetical protein EJK15_31990 [Nonomuraea basaltis]